MRGRTPSFAYMLFAPPPAGDALRKRGMLACASRETSPASRIKFLLPNFAIPSFMIPPRFLLYLEILHTRELVSRSTTEYTEMHGGWVPISVHLCVLRGGCFFGSSHFRFFLFGPV